MGNEEKVGGLYGYAHVHSECMLILRMHGDYNDEWWMHRLRKYMNRYTTWYVWWKALKHRTMMLCKTDAWKI